MTANSFRPSGSNARMAALLAAFLGWMFDGFEIGLFPVISRPALIDLLHLGTAEKALVDSEVGRWNGVIIAAFLAGAATGGVLFGWLGDRIGRVRAVTDRGHGRRLRRYWRSRRERHCGSGRRDGLETIHRHFADTFIGACVHIPAQERRGIIQGLVGHAA